MGRLSSIPPKVAMLGSTVGYGDRQASERERNRRRDESLPYRKWYKTKRWQDVRERVLVRDGYQCQQTGVLLIGSKGAPNSPVVHHIKPHRGDPALFWDESNMQAVSKEWHDRIAQAEEQATMHQRGVWY